ncbi:MAG TPA: hypothetical protein VFU63_09325, partial [Ktedonobacterales bacterium]|nr:hypothetical protein [Ktedonobacterales bacterium]
MSSKHTASRPSEPKAGVSKSAAADHLIEGLIVDGSRGIYSVETPGGIVSCTIRGKLRKDLEYSSRGGVGRQVKRVNVRQHDPVAVGDRVRILPTGGVA